MNTTRIARLAAAVVAVAGLSIVAGPTPDAAACRPMRTPQGIATCEGIYKQRSGGSDARPDADRDRRQCRKVKNGKRVVCHRAHGVAHRR